MLTHLNQTVRAYQEIEILLEKFVTENDLCKVFDAPFDIPLGYENVVQPNILFISKVRLNILDEKYLERVLVLAI